jgi:hypothetical protein
MVRVSLYSAFLLSLSWAPQLSRYIPEDVGCLYDKAAVLDVATIEGPRKSPYLLTYSMDQSPSWEANRKSPYDQNFIMRFFVSEDCNGNINWKAAAW